MKTTCASVLSLLFLFSSLVGCSSPKRIQLDGTWEIALMEKMASIQDIVPTDIEFTETILLPGTTDEAKMGTLNTNTTERNHLSREWIFEGVAYYRNTINIPNQWQDKQIRLHMELTRKSHVWFDDEYLGSNIQCSVPHEYFLGKNIDPGEHTLIIAVDNTLDDWYPKNSHAVKVDTQTNWNGILGEFYIEAIPDVHIDRLRIDSNVERNAIQLDISIINDSEEISPATINLEVYKEEELIQRTIQQNDCKTGKHSIRMNVDLGNQVALWDEFEQNIYHVTARITADGEEHSMTEPFGMNVFGYDDDHFIVNGKIIFLRGKHDACVFPLTGYPPMDVDEWIRILRIAKSYGINHYRFHTWCPPKAAFIAADQVGIYLQPELPLWGALQVAQQETRHQDSDDGESHAFDPSIVNDAERYYLDEGKRIIDEFGNHPSFCMFALGNELWGNRVVMQRIIDSLREYDENRKLFAQGSNNYFSRPAAGKTDDYWTTARTSNQTYDDDTNLVRGSFSFADQRESGPINNKRPSTQYTFSSALRGVNVPVIAHETGQYQYYPDYTEIAKYQGVLKPWNLMEARSLLAEHGMLDQAESFARATGRFASILYCEDMMACVRTPELAGFQLLDLQDYPGQGTALVGPLNSFMESKEHITSDEWRSFCNDIVLIAEYDDYIHESGDMINLTIKIANYSRDTLVNARVELAVFGETMYFDEFRAEQGSITEIAEVSLHAPEVNDAQKYELRMKLQNSDIVSNYPLWVYPKDIDLSIPDNVIVSREMNEALINQLHRGARVLFYPRHEDILELSVGGLFITDYWSYPMFRDICEGIGRPVSPGTLGLLIQDDHPALKGFPTEYHSNWQWWLLTKNSRPIILDEAPQNYRPIVQTIDNMWRSHRLGTLFEFKVGAGSLLVCAIDLDTVKNNIEGRAFYASLLKYIGSDEFQPETEISSDDNVLIKFIQ